MKLPSFVVSCVVGLLVDHAPAQAAPEPAAALAAPVPTPPELPPAWPILAPPDPPEKAKKPKPYKKVRITGFMQMFYRYAFETGVNSQVDPSNFRVQRVRIRLDGKLSRRLSYKVTIDPRAPEIGGVLRDAYLDIKHVIPRHRIRLGQQKTIFGYENGESSTRLFAVNRTEMSDNLARGISLRDMGVSLRGRFALAQGLHLEDGISVVNGAGFNLQDDNNRRKNFFGRLGLRYRTEGLMLRGGISGARGDILDNGADPVDPADDTTIFFKRIGTDVEVDHPWFFLSAEFIYGKEDTSVESGDLLGYYVNLVGKLPYRIGPIVRFDTLGDEYRRVTFGGYFGLAEDRLRVLLNYELRLLKDNERGDDKLYLWTQVRF
jgi:hypothetical protein